jgi:hypothetical protein
VYAALKATTLLAAENKSPQEKVKGVTTPLILFGKCGGWLLFRSFAPLNKK